MLSIAAELSGIDYSFNDNVHKSLASCFFKHRHHISAVTLFIVDLSKTFEMALDLYINLSRYM